MFYNILSVKVVIFVDELREKDRLGVLLTGFPSVESIKQKEYDDKRK